MKKLNILKRLLTLAVAASFFAACSTSVSTDNEGSATGEKLVKVVLNFESPVARSTWAPSVLDSSKVSDIVISTKAAGETSFTQKLTATSASDLATKTLAVSENTIIKAVVTLGDYTYSGTSTYTGGNEVGIVLSADSTQGKIYLDLKNVPAGKNKWVAIYSDSLPETFDAASFDKADATNGYGKTAGTYQLVVVYSSDESLNIENAEGFAIETVTVEAGFTTNVTPEFKSEVASIYTVTFSPNYEGGENKTVRVAGGKTVTAPEFTRTGYTLEGWYTDSECSNAFVVSSAINSSITVYAKWNVNKYTVSFDKNNGQGDAPASVEVEYGSTPVLPAMSGYVDAEKTYLFLGWNTDLQAAAALESFTVPAQNVTLYAIWEVSDKPAWTVTFENTSLNAVQVFDGQKVTKPADPVKTGFVFDGWYSDSSCTVEFDFSTLISANTSIYAKFIPEVNVSVSLPSPSTSAVTPELNATVENLTIKFTSSSADAKWRVIKAGGLSTVKTGTGAAFEVDCAVLGTGTYTVILTVDGNTNTASFTIN